MDNNNQSALVALNRAKEDFALAMKEAQSLDIVNNVTGAFEAALVVNKLEAVLTDEVMKAVFVPLMNKKIGFLTDRDPNKKDKKTGQCPTPYPISVVRTCIIDAASVGLLPTGNQFNIISGSMYPAKAGFTALLGKMKQKMGLVYSFEFDPEAQVKSSDPSYVAIPCRIPYKTNLPNLPNGIFRHVAMVKSNGETSTTDQLRGKAERKAKKAFVEFLTGMDLGDGDTDTVDVAYTEVSSADNHASVPSPAGAPAPMQSAKAKAQEILERRKAAGHPAEQPQEPANEPRRVGDIIDNMGMGGQPAAAPTAPADGLQPNLNFDAMTDEQIEAFANANMDKEGGVQ